MAMRGNHPLSIHEHCLANLTYHQGLNFSPFTTDERHESTIDAEQEFIGSWLNLWPGLLDVLGLGQLHCLIRKTNAFGLPLGGRFAHLSVGKTSEHSGSFGKWHPGTQPGEVLLKQRGQAPRQQSQLLIE